MATEFLQTDLVHLDVQILFLRNINDIHLELLLVIIWKALLKQYSLINFVVHTIYILKSIPENLEDICYGLDLLKINLNSCFNYYGVAIPRQVFSL